MTLTKLNDLDPHHHRTIKGKDIRQFTVWTEQAEQIGRVVDALVDETERLCYLVIERSPAFGGNQVLLSPDQIRVDLNEERVYLNQLDRGQFTQLPVHHPAHQTTSNQINSQSISRTTVTDINPQSTPQPVAVTHASMFLEDSVPLETSTPLEVSTPLESPVRNSFAVEQEITTVAASAPTPAVKQAIAPAPTDSVPQNHSVSTSTSEEHSIRLLEERLVVNPQRRKVGEVIVRKEIETRMIEVPVRREKLVIEQVSPEHKQLALIDLKGDTSDALELRHATTAEANPVVTGEFASIDAAIHLLKLIAAKSNSGCESVQLTLVLNDASYQSIYQDWFRQYTQS